MTYDQEQWRRCWNSYALTGHSGVMKAENGPSQHGVVMGARSTRSQVVAQGSVRLIAALAFIQTVISSSWSSR